MFDMMWFTGTICFAIGLCLGALLFSRFKSDTKRIRQLEEELAALQSTHAQYQEQVSSHFSTTAELFHNLTDSYRSVYQHLASGAQALCPEPVANRLSLDSDRLDTLPARTLEDPEAQSQPEQFTPPLDYAQREPDQKGNLSEDYGLGAGRTPAS